MSLCRARDCEAHRRNSTDRHGSFPGVRYEAGSRISCAAFEDYWGGRPFLDSVEMSGPQQNRGLADVIELAVNVPSRQVPEHTRLWTSAMSDLIAIPWFPTTRRCSAMYSVFARPGAHCVRADAAARPAGVLAAARVGVWIRVYFRNGSSIVGRGRKQAAARMANSIVVIGYSSGDSLARLVAERLVLNARYRPPSTSRSAGRSDDSRGSGGVP